MLSKKFDIVAISETWLRKNIYNNKILPAGYILYRNDRGTKGGGVMLAINNKLTCERLTIPDDIEALAVTINSTKNKKLIFGIVYIPPNSSDAYHSSVFNFIRTLPQSNNIVIVGDFNYPDIDWLTLSGTNLNSSSFCDLIFDTNLVQLVETSTHSAGHILDLVLTNQHSNIQNLTLDSKPPSHLLSDHLMIRFDIICDIGSSDKTTKSTCSLNYSKANWEGINQFLSQYNFDLLFSLPDSDTKWAFIKNAILEAVHQFTPCVRST